MNAARPNALGLGLSQFFHEYLPTLRGLSPRTIEGYRDSLVLLLQFLVAHQHKRADLLDLEDFTADTVSEFLLFLETDRHNCIGTRNTRLAALRTFAKFLCSHHPEHMAALQAILNIPSKRGRSNLPIEYLEESEVKALLSSIDRATSAGRRDYALFALMFNTGARVQEVLDLRLRDLRLDPPCQVRLKGKGNKVRLCPIWPQTANLLRALCAENKTANAADSMVFVNCHGVSLTRFGVRYLLRKYVSAASVHLPALATKRIHPHSLRHSTAIHLLKAGVDFVVISQWLGHANLDTTMRYARADLDIKRQALCQVFPDVLAPSNSRTVPFAKVNPLDWLRKL